MTNIAVSALVANSITQGVFNLNIKDFLLSETGAEFSNPTAGQKITLRELVSGLSGGNAGTYGSMKGLGGTTVRWGGSFGEQITENLKMNAVPLAVGVIGIPIAVRVAMKLIRKPVILPANRMLKSAGLDVKV